MTLKCTSSRGFISSSTDGFLSATMQCHDLFVSVPKSLYCTWISYLLLVGSYLQLTIRSVTLDYRIPLEVGHFFFFLSAKRLLVALTQQFFLWTLGLHIKCHPPPVLQQYII